jgi:hypothetical protein
MLAFRVRPQRDASVLRNPAVQLRAHLDIGEAPPNEFREPCPPTRSRKEPPCREFVFSRHGGSATRTKSKVSQRSLLRNCVFYGRQQLPSALKAEKWPEAASNPTRNHVRIWASMEPLGGACAGQRGSDAAKRIGRPQIARIWK